jgi:CubicO group peptidase (beta-lactamase class C family)
MMKKMLRRFILTALSIVLTLACFIPARMEGTESLAQKAGQIANTIVSDYGVTSVQYALIDHDSIMLSGSSGVFDKSENRAITKDDMYGIGSTSKMFATAAAMVLWDQGLIDLDEPLTTYISEFTMLDERYTEITARMLMNHSSGLYGSSFSNTFLYDDNDTVMHDNLLSELAKQQLKAAPGEYSVYCNDGFTLLEILVERVSGMQYTDFLVEHFIEPLGLENTKTPQNDFDKAKRLVKVYMPFYADQLPDESVNALGTGGLYSTAEDLCKFAQVLMGKRPDLLSEQATTLMQNEEYKRGMWVEAKSGNYIGEYGLGWDTVHGFPFVDYGLQALSKGGDTQLFHSSLVIIPSLDIAMAVASSGGESFIDYAFAASILQEYLLEKGIIPQIAPQRTLLAPVQTEMPKELEAYLGLYVNTSACTSVEVKDGVLTLSPLNGGSETKWMYAGEQGFLNEDGSITLSFSQQTDGELYLVKGQLISLPGVGQVSFIDLVYQMVKPYAVEDSLMDAWEERAGKAYYLVSEKSTCQAFLLGADGVRMRLNEDFSSGFAYSSTKIVDENHAVNIVKLRDATDLEFFAKDGMEYVNAYAMVYIREDFIPELTLQTSSAVIGEDGFTLYYTIGAEAQGKTMVVTLPKDAAYAVYDENGVCVNFTTVSKNNTTVLPEKGKIALIGKTGDVFAIEFQ